MAQGTRRYKEPILQQLRSLCETARHGSFVAAARVLDVSQPTVWKQVHALEQHFGAKLVEPHGRGCTMTAAGRQLLELVGPAVETIAVARERFQTLRTEEGVELTVALTPRMLLDDFAICVSRYHTKFSTTRFEFLELPDDEIAGAVLDRRADFGFTPSPLTPEQNKLLTAEPAYPLEVRLIAPKDHPLARRRVIRPKDLAPYSIVNRPPLSMSTSYARFIAESQAGRRGARGLVRMGFASSIRRFVTLGYGIGLLTVARSVPPDPELHERSMRRYFDDLIAYLIRRRGGYIPDVGEEFICVVRQELGAELAGAAKK